MVYQRLPGAKPEFKLIPAVHNYEIFKLVPLKESKYEVFRNNFSKIHARPHADSASIALRNYFFKK